MSKKPDTVYVRLDTARATNDAIRRDGWGCFWTIIFLVMTMLVIGLMAGA